MEYWLFKCNPNRFRIDDRLRDPEPTTTWLVTRYKKDIAPGDIAFIWRGGTDGGIVATMRIDSSPHEREELLHEREYWASPGEVLSQVRVTGMFLNRFAPVPAVELREIPELENLCIFHGWQQATNFRVSQDEGKALLAFLEGE